MVHFGMRPERTTSNPIYSHSSTPLPRPSPTSLGSYQIQKTTPHVVDSILPQCCVLMLLARGDIGRPPSISLDRSLNVSISRSLEHHFIETLLSLPLDTRQLDS